jgi:hypothetical protein
VLVAGCDRTAGFDEALRFWIEDFSPGIDLVSTPARDEYAAIG